MAIQDMISESFQDSYSSIGKRSSKCFGRTCLEPKIQKTEKEIVLLGFGVAE